MNVTRPFRLIGGIFAATSFLLLGVAAWSAHRQYTVITTWPAVDATVLDSRVTHETGMSTGNSSQDTTMYKTEIEFQYRVGGKDYTTPSESNYSSSSYAEMKRNADAFPPGSVRRILYNPSDPNDITFSAGYTFGFFFLPVLFTGMGLLFAVMGLAFFKVAAYNQPLTCRVCGQPVQRNQKFCGNCANPVAPF
jgi:hypothetical protein